MLDLIVFVQEAEKEKCPNEHQFPLLTIGLHVEGAVSELAKFYSFI